MVVPRCRPAAAPKGQADCPCLACRQCHVEGVQGVGDSAPGTRPTSVQGSRAFRVSQGDHESLIAGDLVLTNTSHPMENEGVGAGGQVEAVVLQTPRTVLLLRSDRVDRLRGSASP